MSVIEAVWRPEEVKKLEAAPAAEVVVAETTPASAVEVAAPVVPLEQVADATGATAEPGVEAVPATEEAKTEGNK
jgi:hypothetical protein